MTTFSSSLTTEVQVVYRRKLPLHPTVSPCTVLPTGHDFVHKYRSRKLPSVKKQPNTDLIK